MERIRDQIEGTSSFDEGETAVDFENDETLAAAPGGLPVGVVPGTMVGEYRIERKVAEGGMAEIYAGVHPVIGKKVAVKVLSEAQCAESVGVERFVQEACAVNRIGHPNIVDVFSFGQLADGRSYMVMEWLHGRTLGQRQGGIPLPVDDCIEILDEIADALQAAHAQGIAHRDLKPDNVFLVEQAGDRRAVKLLDFGIAKLVDEQSSSRRTMAGMCVGTPGYMSPEQARGLELDCRTDIYSLGVLAFEMVTGRLPFDGKTSMDIVVKQISIDPPSPSAFRPGIPATLSSIIVRMLDVDVERRATLAEVRTALAKLQAANLRHTGAMPTIPAPSGTLPGAPRFVAVGTSPQRTSSSQVRVTFRGPSESEQTADAADAMAPYAVEVHQPALQMWKNVVSLVTIVVFFALFAAIVTSAVKRHVEADAAAAQPTVTATRAEPAAPLVERGPIVSEPLVIE